MVCCMNPEIDWFFQKSSPWQESYAILRTLVLDCGLKEEQKWGCPCYTFQNKNVVLIHGFKNYCALLFMRGALINDTKGLLIRQSENVQSARQMRFTNSKEILRNKSVIKIYVKEALKIEKAGLTVKLKSTAEYKVPDEFQAVLQEMPDVKTAFQALTPGRQRGYLLFFAAPKQAKTREARIVKCLPGILAGKGLND